MEHRNDAAVIIDRLFSNEPGWLDALAEAKDELQRVQMVYDALGAIPELVGADDEASETFKAMLESDIRAGKRYLRPPADLLATAGALDVLRPVLLDPNNTFLNPNGIGVAPPKAAVPFIVSLLERDASRVSVDFYALMLSCYGPEAMAPAEKVLIKLLNDPEYMRVQGVNVAMRILRRQQPMSGECTRHSGAWPQSLTTPSWRVPFLREERGRDRWFPTL